MWGKRSCPVLAAALAIVAAFGIQTALADTWQYDWNSRTDRYGKPAGVFSATPFPITENVSAYSITYDEGTVTYNLGTKYYVDGGRGNDANNGLSPAAAKATINAAIHAAGQGNKTILVRGAHDGFDGVYREGFSLKSGDDDTHRWMVVGYGQERPVLEGYGVTATGAVSYATLQRFRIQNNQRNGVYLRTDDDYNNIVDVGLYNNAQLVDGCGAPIADANIYLLGSDNCRIYHCTSERTHCHGFKVGDDASNIIVEWSVTKEAGYWEGYPCASRTSKHPTALDFPADGPDIDSDADGTGDTNDNLVVRYNIVGTSLFYGVQLRHSPNFNFHHNEVYDAIHFGQVGGTYERSLGEEGVSAVLIYESTTYGTMDSNLIRDPGPNINGRPVTGIRVDSVKTSAGAVNLTNNVINGFVDSSAISVGNTTSTVNISNNVINGSTAFPPPSTPAPRVPNPPLILSIQ